MSQPDVELVKDAFEAWNSDLDSFMRFLAEDVEWNEVGGRIDRPRSLGRDTLQQGLESLFDTWQSYRLEPEEVRQVKDRRVVAILREVARGRTSGLEVDSRWGYVITVRDRHIVRVDAYRDPRKALAAVGLEEPV